MVDAIAHQVETGRRIVIVAAEEMPEIFFVGGRTVRFRIVAGCRLHHCDTDDFIIVNMGYRVVILKFEKRGIC